MVNHFFTILLNEPQTNVANITDIFNIPLYIDPTFRPKVIPADISNFYQFLYGQRPDIYGKLYKTYQFVNFIALSPYANYLDTFDSRKTIDFINSNLATLPALGYRLFGPALDTLKISGTYKDTIGRMVTTWRVVLDTVNATITNLVTKQISIVNKSRIPYSLPGSYLKLSFTTSVPSSGYWTIQAITTPYPTLEDIYANIDKQIPSMLFPEKEPYITFKNIYNDTLFPTNKLIGAILALGFHLNEVIQ